MVVRIEDEYISFGNLTYEGWQKPMLENNQRIHLTTAQTLILNRSKIFRAPSVKEAALANELEQAKAEIKKLKGDHEKKDMIIQRLLAEKEEKDACIKRFGEKVKQATSGGNVILTDLKRSEAGNQSSCANTEIQRLEHKIEVLEADYNYVQELLQTASKEFDEREEGYETRIQTMEHQNQDLQARLAQSMKAQVLLKQGERVIEGNYAIIGDFQKKYDSLVCEAAKKDKDIRERTQIEGILRAKVAAAHEKIDRQKKDLKIFAKAFRDQDSEITQLKQEITRLKFEADTKEKALEGVKSHWKDLSIQKREMKEHIRNLDHRIEMRWAQIRQLERDIVAIEKSKDDQICGLEDEVANLKILLARCERRDFRHIWEFRDKVVEQQKQMEYKDYKVSTLARWLTSTHRKAQNLVFWLKQELENSTNKFDEDFEQVTFLLDQETAKLAKIEGDIKEVERKMIWEFKKWEKEGIMPQEIVTALRDWVYGEEEWSEIGDEDEVENLRIEGEDGGQDREGMKCEEGPKSEDKDEMKPEGDFLSEASKLQDLFNGQSEG